MLNVEPTTRCLSVREPWAWLLTGSPPNTGGPPALKPIENRTWVTNHRGRIAIHASGNFSEGCEVAREIDAYDTLLLTECLMPGYIVGSVELFGIINFSHFDRGERGSPEHLESLAFDLDESGRTWLRLVMEQYKTDHYDWAEGPYCWLVANAVRFPSPIRAKGRQSLWRLSDEQREAVAKQEAEVLAATAAARKTGAAH